jgi:hypothetical protein
LEPSAFATPTWELTIRHMAGELSDAIQHRLEIVPVHEPDPRYGWIDGNNRLVSLRSVGVPPILD